MTLAEYRNARQLKTEGEALMEAHEDAVRVLCERLDEHAWELFEAARALPDNKLRRDITALAQELTTKACGSDDPPRAITHPLYVPWIKLRDELPTAEIITLASRRAPTV